MSKHDDIWRANIRILRLRSGKTKTELCASIGMSRRFWDDVESGAKEPSMSTLERIATALGVTVVDLLEPLKKRQERLEGARR